MMYAVCEGIQMLPSQEKVPVVDQLITLHGKMHNVPLDDQNADGTVLLRSSDVVTIGEMVQVLARDIVAILRAWYAEDTACTTMIVELEESERDFTAVLDTVRQRRSV
jgi:hypothetical protein